MRYLPPDIEGSEKLRIQARNLVLLKEADGIAAVLERRGVSAVFLKGIALLDFAYSDLSARPMVDIDVLVHAGDLHKVRCILSGMGFESHPNALTLNKAGALIPVQIDLHTDLYYFDVGRLWQRCRQKQINSSRMWILSAEDLLLHAILHAVLQDGEVSPQAMRDCKQILASDRCRFQWSEFLGLVQAEGWETPVALFLRRYVAAFPGTVPDEVIRALEYWRRSHKRWISTRFPYMRILAMQSSSRRRFQLLRRIIFPDSSYLRMRYSRVPKMLGFLLPFYRLLSLMNAALAGAFYHPELDRWGWIQVIHRSFL